MAKVATYVQSFNTGVHDKTALTRTDLERMRLAAEEQTNLLCKAVGPGFMRPGLQYLTTTDDNAQARLKEFVFGASDAALMEFTDLSFRVFVNDVVVTRNAVSCTVVNGDFSSATGWDTTGVGGGTATIAGGSLRLNATCIEGIAQCARSVTTASVGVEHALRIIVDQGPVIFRCGSTNGADDYVSKTSLPTGQHSLAFTPTGTTFYVQLSSTDRVERRVDSIQIEAAGEMVIPTPWSLDLLPKVRFAQSADVFFVACEGLQQRRIERRAAHSWSVCLYVSDDGPMSIDADTTVRLRPNALEGNTSLFSSTGFFVPGDVSGLFRLSHTGQTVVQSLGQEDVYTDTVKIVGIHQTTGGDRDFSIVVSGAWTGTLTVQKSYNDPETGFVDVDTITANGSYPYNDEGDNINYYYRVGFHAGDYGSGVATVTIGYKGGGGDGICRVTQYVSPTQVQVEILVPFKATTFTRDWNSGEWSDHAGWPSAVALSDGRLWWSGADRIWGSVSDAFASFDDTTEGDSGPISRSIATGGVNDTQWILSLKRLLVGTEGAVASVKSSSLDEPLTPTNFGIKDASTTGAAAIDAIKVDTRGIFVERAGSILLEMTFDGQEADYVVTQISKLTTDVFESGVSAIAVQRRPDTRIWLVLNDGSCVCMVYEPEDQVLAFIPIATDGFFESVAVLPALLQDRVYFSIRRTINGSTVRYIEKMAMDTEVTPDTLCKTVDSHASGVNSPASATIAVGTHLIGESVVVWGDGAPIETSYGVPAQFTVDGSGNVTLPSAVANWAAGLPYRARYKSARLAYGAQGGTAMLQKKTVDGLGIIMTDFVRSGIKYGHSFSDPYRGLFPLPQMAEGKMQPNVVLSDVRDEEIFSFPGEWSTDSRVCLEVNSPYTAAFTGMVFQITTNER